MVWGKSPAHERQDRQFDRRPVEEPWLSEDELHNFGRVLVGRYVDMDAQIDHHFTDASNPNLPTTRHASTYGSFVQFIKAANDTNQHVEVIDDNVFITYYDLTQQVNTAATLGGRQKSPRRIQSDHEKIVTRIESLVERECEHQTDYSSAENERRVAAFERNQEERDLSAGYFEPLDDDFSLQSILDPLAWSNQFRLPVTRRMFAEEDPYRNMSCSGFGVQSDSAQVSLDARLVELFKMENIIGVRKHSTMLPVFMFTETHSARTSDLPTVFKPPASVPVGEVRALHIMGES